MDKDFSNRESEILRKVVEIIKKYVYTDKIILFGSRTKKKHSKHADFDLAVDSENVNITLLRKIKEEVDEVAGLYNVDIVFLKSVDQDFKRIILKTGEVIFGRNT